MKTHYKGVKLSTTSEVVNERIIKAINNSVGRMSKDPSRSGMVHAEFVENLRYVK